MHFLKSFFSLKVRGETAEFCVSFDSINLAGCFVGIKSRLLVFFCILGAVPPQKMCVLRSYLLTDS